MPNLPIITPTLQLGFYRRLVEAQNSFLLPALLDQVSTLDIGLLDSELVKLAGNEKLAFVARKGIRGELVFPTPYLLKAKPSLLGYYRLLLGFSQKEFYKGPFGKYKKLEDQGFISNPTQSLLNDLCVSLIESSWLLINGLPDLSHEILKSLTLLTLGPQLRGSRNVNLGIEANQTVFALIKSIISKNILQEGLTVLEVKSAAGRIFRIEFAPDPDIAIRQLLQDGSFRNRIAIEIKGGTDFSNIHNRLGEAEKSHQKAKGDGFTQFWTVINVSDISPSIWRQETPTTNELFYLEKITDVRTTEHSKFKEYLISELGI
jgi:hypothetical protein